MKASTKMCLVNIVALVAFVTSLGGVLAADPTTPMYVGFSLSLSLSLDHVSISVTLGSRESC